MTIRPVSDLRNKFSEISDYVHQTNEPVFLTRNGHGDMAVMSMETYEKMVARFQLHDELDRGLDDLEHGRVVNAEDAFAAVRNRSQAK